MNSWSKNKHTYSYQFSLALIGLLVLISYQALPRKQDNASVEKISATVVKNNSSQTSEKLNSNVKLRIVEQTHGTVVLALENNSDRTIYTSYSPPRGSNKLSFVPYGLERR